MGLERHNGVDTAIDVVVRCDFLVEAELRLREGIIGFLEYCYRCIITITLYLRMGCERSELEFIYTMRFQSQESRACGGSARDLLLAQSKVLDDADILNAMPASVHQQQRGSPDHKSVKALSSREEARERPLKMASPSKVETNCNAEIIRTRISFDFQRPICSGFTHLSALINITL